MSAPYSSHAYNITPSPEATRSLWAEWSDAIRAQMQDMQKTSEKSHQVEWPRYSLLLDACSRNDLFYVILHKIFGLWTWNKSESLKMLDIPPPKLDDAFEKLGTILKPTGLMSSKHISWLSAFPESFYDERLRLSVVQSELDRLSAFTSCFASGWMPLLGDITSRQYPIMAWEVAIVLRCSSQLLAEILFTYTRRLLGCADGQIANQLGAAFAKDMRNETILNKMLPPGASSEVDDRRQATAFQYRQLVSSARAQSTQDSLPRITQGSATSEHATTPNVTAAASNSTRSSSRPQAIQSPIVDTRGPSSVSSLGSSQSTSNSQTAVQVPSQQNQPNTANSNIQVVSAQPDSAPTHSTPPLLLPSMLISSNAGPGPDRLSDAAVQAFDKALEQAARKRIPPSYQARSPYDWTSVRNSLHLSGVRSPRRVPVTPTLARHYQSFSHFAVEPRLLRPQADIQAFEFNMPERDMGFLARTMSDGNGPDITTVGYFDGCQRYRLRACQASKNATGIEESEWIIRQTSWPEVIYIQVNGRVAQLRRKHHFHFDLAVELTDLVQAGSNKIEICLPDITENTTENGVFFVAIDVVKTMSHDSVIAMVMAAPRFSVDSTREEISRRLTASAQEDELVVVDNSLSISVADPFTSSIFSIPVRGVKCRHLACFDLENWLQSRQSKPVLEVERAKAEPSLADVWACPLCDQDARPQSLQIDEMFVGIRHILAEQGNLDVKMIKVSDKGTWNPVIPPANRSRSVSARTSVPVNTDTTVIRIDD